MCLRMIWARKFSKQVISNNLSYSFSGAGWLTPYHLGVINGLKELNLISSKSTVSGSSGGAIAAVLISTNVNELDALTAFKQSVHLAKPMHNIDTNLRQMLHEMLPKDAYLLCTNSCHITVTKLSSMKTKTPLIISEFISNEDLIDCIATSCFIPFYCAPKLYTIFRQEKHIDGGLFAFLPPVGEITVNPLPQIGKYMLNPRHSVIHPLLVPDFKVPLKSMIRWSLFPPSAQVLDDLFQLGKKSAHIWAKQRESQRD
jgi:hypothetical protein